MPESLLNKVVGLSAFLIWLLYSKSFGHETWPTNRCGHWQYY